MKDTREAIDLVEGREPGADVAESRNLAAETPDMRDLRDAIDGVLAVWPVLSDSAKAGLVGAMLEAAREAKR